MYLKYIKAFQDHLCTLELVPPTHLWAIHSSRKTFYKILQCVCGHFCPFNQKNICETDTDVVGPGSQSPLQFIPKVVDGVECKCECKAGWVLPHQSHATMPFCMLLSQSLNHRIIQIYWYAEALRPTPTGNKATPEEQTYSTTPPPYQILQLAQLSQAGNVFLAFAKTRHIHDIVW